MADQATTQETTQTTETDAATQTVVEQATTQLSREQITSIDQVPQSIRTQIEMAHKKNLRNDLDQAKQQLQQLNTLKDNVGGFMEMLGGKVTIEEGSDLGDVASQISSTLDTLKDEKEKVDAANAKQSELLAAAQKEAADNLTLLHSTIVRNALTNEIQGNDKATSKKTGDCIADELAQYAVVGEDRSVTFAMDVTDENGHTQKQSLGVSDAVAKLEANAEWKDFFKATRNSGAGGEVIDNVQRTREGDVDLKSLAQSEDGVRKFMEIMENNPALINDVYQKASPYDE